SIDRRSPRRDARARARRRRSTRRRNPRIAADPKAWSRGSARLPPAESGARSVRPALRSLSRGRRLFAAAVDRRRDPDRETRAASFVRFDGDAPPVALDDRPDERQTQPASGDAVGRMRLPPVERLEDVPAFGRPDARAAVLD